MSKKQANLNKLFKEDEVAKIPTSKATLKKEEAEEKTTKQFIKHRLFDNPEQIEEPSKQGDSIIEIDTSLVYIPTYKVDRKFTDIAAINALADQMAGVGQVQPCTVRLSNKIKNKKYELIFGERRYRAAVNKGLKLKVVVKDIDDTHAGLMLLAENAHREDTCDFSMGEQLNELLNTQMLKQQDLVNKLGMSRQKISRLLSYRKIPETVFDAIGDFNKVSSGTAEKIKQLCNRNEAGQNAIVSLAEKIASGKLGHEKLTLAVEKITDQLGRSKKESKKFYTEDGRVAFTLRADNNGNDSFHFPKGVDVSLLAKKLLTLIGK